MLPHHLILSGLVLLSPSTFPSIRSFPMSRFNHIRWPKYWSFTISPSSECLGLISFRTDWFDLLAVQEALRSLLQHHSIKASVTLHSVFFMVQISHPYITTRKTVALTIWTFVNKVMSLLLNMLSRFVIAFLPKSKLLNFVAAFMVHSDFGAQVIKICHCFHFCPIYLHIYYTSLMYVETLAF